MKKTECNQLFESSRIDGNVSCKYRCKVTKFEIETGKLGKTKEKTTSTHTNQCRLKTKQNRTCSHPEDSEKTCHLPRR